MKKVFNGSIKDLMCETELDSYTQETTISLFRCFLETIIENRYDSVILAKLTDSEKFNGILKRLKFSSSKVYTYSSSIDGFKNLEINNPNLNNDEFLIILAERFSAIIYWNNLSDDNFGLCEGFCSLNTSDSKKVVDYLQSQAYSKELEEDIDNILQDRRNNEKFTTILRKLVINLESGQRDIICANSELNELYQKNDQAERLAAIGQLCSTIAHELRNPLSVINLHAKIIQKNIEQLQLDNQKISDQIKNSSDLISKSSINLEKMLSELLDYSKPITLEKENASIEEIITEIINLIKPSYIKNNVDLRVINNLKDSPNIYFDKSKLHQVMFNLLKNALESSEPEKKVTVKLEKCSSDNYIDIKVCDEGNGISQENLEKIFKPYFTTKKEGTGLGLAQAKKIIEAHNGHLKIESTDNNGTVFLLKLPVQNNYFQLN